MNPIRMLIADDDAGMRLVMRKLAESAEGYELVGEAEDGAALIRLYDELGYAVYGRVPCAYRRRDGTYRDEGLMVKALGP